MSNNIEALREHLFDALKGLKDKSIDIERAKAMSDIAQTIINSAKVEVEYAKATGSKGSGFLEKQAALPMGITGTTVHKIR
jgi:hypothetical protein